MRAKAARLLSNVMVQRAISDARQAQQVSKQVSMETDGAGLADMRLTGDAATPARNSRCNTRRKVSNGVFPMGCFQGIRGFEDCGS